MSTILSCSRCCDPVWPTHILSARGGLDNAEDCESSKCRYSCFCYHFNGGWNCRWQISELLCLIYSHACCNFLLHVRTCNSCNFCFTHQSWLTSLQSPTEWWPSSLGTQISLSNSPAALTPQWRVQRCWLLSYPTPPQGLPLDHKTQLTSASWMLEVKTKLATNVVLLMLISIPCSCYSGVWSHHVHCYWVRRCCDVPDCETSILV